VLGRLHVERRAGEEVRVPGMVLRAQSRRRVLRNRRRRARDSQHSTRLPERHSGNANLFAGATLYMQTAEHDAVFGPEPQKYVSSREF